MAKRRKISSLSSSWGQLTDNYFSMYRNSLQWYEMLAASAATIGMRLTSINDDLKRNRLPDQIELQRMITEKNKAMTKSAFALADWQSSLVRTSAPGKSGKLDWPLTNPSALWTSGFNSGFSLWSDMMARNIELSGAMLKGYAQVLKPFHSASTANAFRLSGVRKKVR